MVISKITKDKFDLLIEGVSAKHLAMLHPTPIEPAEVRKPIGLSMFQVLEESSGNFIALKAMGKITAKDYDTLVPYLEMAIDREGPLCLFCDMSEFSGMEFAAMWRDLKFGIGHSRDFHRLAVVGGRKWMEWCVKLTAPLFKAEIICFGPGQAEEARTWLSN